MYILLTHCFDISYDISLGYIVVVEYLCNTHNAVMDSVNEEGWSPLHLACVWYVLMDTIVYFQ